MLLFLDPGSEIRDPGWLKIRIRDKHPGSATLLFSTPQSTEMYRNADRGHTAAVQIHMFCRYMEGPVREGMLLRCGASRMVWQVMYVTGD